MHCLCFYLLCQAGTIGASLFHSDGMIIQEQGNTQTVGAVWVVLVTINPPTPLPMQEWVRRVRYGITSAGKQVYAGDKQVWEARLSALGLQSTMQSISPQPVMQRTLQRLRRGLVDLIGEASLERVWTKM